MPHDIRVIPAKEFLRANVHGQVDLASSKALLTELAAAVGPGQHILIDSRDTGKAILTSLEIYDLVQTLRALGLGLMNKIAILRHHTDGFDRARFFQLLANDRGFAVGAFEDFEAAFGWLYGDDTKPAT